MPIINEKKFISEMDGKAKIAFEKYERNLRVDTTDSDKLFFKAGFLSGYQYCLADDVKTTKGGKNVTRNE